MPTDGARRAALEAAEARAVSLLTAIERSGMLAPGRSEREVEEDIFTLARRDFGVERHWHKGVVRAGANTIAIAGEHPDMRIIAADDIVYIDLGPVFAAWEADIGKSYAFGTDQRKHALVAELPRQFDLLQTHYRANPDISGAALYAFAQENAAAAGWRFGGKIAGHIVSEFAHALIPGDRDLGRISPKNSAPLSEPDGHGRMRHWIGEIHLIEQDGSFGGFYERLL